MESSSGFCKKSCIADDENGSMIEADPCSGFMGCRSSIGYYSTKSITAFPTRTPTLMAAVLSLSHLHSITVRNCEADSALVANKAFLEVANKLDTPRRIVE